MNPVPKLLVFVVVLASCDPLLVEVPEPPPVEERQVPLETLLDGAVYVRPNPNGISPLTAEVTLATKVPVQVTLEVLGAEPLVQPFDTLALEHRLPILGLYPGIENQIVLRLFDPERGVGTDTLRIATDPVPAFFPAIEMVTAEPMRMEPGWTLANLSIGDAGVFRTFPVVFDTRGAIRWYLDLSGLGGMAFLVRRLANGNLLTGYGPALYEYDMLGAEQRRWEIPGYWYHHDVIEKPDGNLIVAVDKSGIGTIEDHVIEIDRATGAVVTEWDLRQVLDVQRRDFMDDEADWFHMNAVWYDAADDALIISGRNQGVVKVTRANELVWILAPHQGWGLAGLEGTGPATADYLLTAVDADGVPYPEAVQQGIEDAPGFSWPWGQHAPLLTPGGTLFLFDNGLLRNFSPDTPPFSRGVEYVIDEAAMTVQQVWQYGQERAGAFHSAIISDVDVLPETGNRLIMPGINQIANARALVTEVTYPGRDIVFEAHVRFKDQLSTGTGWGQLDIVYRFERLPLYPPQGSATGRPLLRTPIRTPR